MAQNMTILMQPDSWRALPLDYFYLWNWLQILRISALGLGHTCDDHLTEV
jgi:hypothetical protein